MTENGSTESPPAPSPFYYGVPLLIVLAVGAVFFLGEKTGNEDKVVPSRKVVVGKDYYVLVTLMEFHPAKRGGASWDGGSSAPDLYYQLSWHGKTIYHTKNDVVKNVLIAKWFGLGANVSVMDLRKVLSNEGQRLSPRNLIKAASIFVEPNGELVIRAYDDDPLRDDFAGGCAIPLADGGRSRRVEAFCAARGGQRAAGGETRGGVALTGHESAATSSVPRGGGGSVGPWALRAVYDAASGLWRHHPAGAPAQARPHCAHHLFHP
jgi:hypothetical protein